MRPKRRASSSTATPRATSSRPRPSASAGAATARLVLSPTGAMAIEVRARTKPRAGSAAAGRTPGPAPRHCAPTEPQDLRMMGVEPAGQRAECGHDELGRRRDEAAARDLAALEVQPQLGMEMAGDFRPRLVAHRFVAKDDPGDLDLILDAARRNGRRSPDRGCRRSTSSRGVAVSSVSSARALGRQPVAAEAVVEAVAEAIEPRRAGRARRRRRARSASRANHRAEGTGRAARTSSLFRGAGRRPAAPAARARTARRRRVAKNVSPANEKGTMGQL